MACTAVALKSEMSAFYGGSSTRYRHPFNRYFVFSEGMKTVADVAGAYWLIDLVAFKVAPLYARAWDAGETSIGVVKLIVPPKTDRTASASVSVSLSDDAPDVFTEKLDYTDFPEGQWNFYLGRDELADGTRTTTLIIPEEY